MSIQHLEAPAEQLGETDELFHYAPGVDIEQCIEMGMPFVTLCGAILTDVPEIKDGKEPHVCEACHMAYELIGDLEQL